MLAGPLTTFGDLARDGLELEISCPNCGHRRVIDGSSPRVRARRVAGARFRCEKCGSVGLPSLGRSRAWPRRAAEHARKVRERTGR